MMTTSEYLREAQERLIGIRRNYYGGYDMKKAIGIITRIGRCREPKFVIDDSNRFVFENMIRWVRGDAEFMCHDLQGNPIKGSLTKGIMIAGPTGTGKTMAMAVMQEYAAIKPIVFYARGSVKLLPWITVRTDQICDEFSEKGLLTKYKDAPSICLNDLGAEPLESMYMGNRRNVMREILEARGDRDTIMTMITTNYPLGGKRLQEMYGDRAVSRMHGMCNYFILKGDDRRQI